MGHEVDELLGIRDDTHEGKPAEVTVRELTHWTIKALSLPIPFTLVALALLLLASLGRIAGAGYGNLVWLSGAISVVASLGCAIYGALRWRLLATTYKVVVIIHALLVFSLAAAIIAGIWLLTQGDYPSKM